MLGMGGMPISASASSSANAAADWGGSNFSASGAGDWNVNLAGSGTALQTATSGLNWMLIAAGLAVFLLLKK